MSAVRPQLAVGLSICLVGAFLVGVFLLPTSAPRAAISDDAVGGAVASTPASSTSFGEATPTEKFVQSFQQQVSQQLQTALTQSNDAQEARLRVFEQQQRTLGEQLQAIEQTMATAHSPPGVTGPQRSTGSVAAPEATDIEPPRVNVRRSGSPDDTGVAPAISLQGLVPGWTVPTYPLSAAANPAINPGHGLATPSPDDQQVATPNGIPGTRTRLVDANIAPHGFVEGRLLNGVVAIQGGAERDSIVALSGSYQSANGFQSDLDGCFALVQGRPEISSGRIDFKLSRLTCNFSDGASRTWDASGWLVDADGIRGVRATIVDNTARKAGVAAVGGAIGGFGQRLSQQQYQVNSSPIGLGSSSSFAGDAGRDAIGGAASGAANAFGQSIADYYNLYAPSLQVGGGTRVTVVLANDLRLPPSGREISQTHYALP